MVVVQFLKCFSKTVVLLFLCLQWVDSDRTNGTRAVPSLKFLVIVSKHGARAPTHTYPRDPYRDRTLWPEGAGQITKTGKRQMFHLGERLRRLYHGFLSEYYERLRVMVQATLVDRTILSASTLLAGLYPPVGYQRWHPNITWQPMIIYPNLMDKALLSLDPKQCPRYEHEQNNSLAELTSHYSEHPDVYRAISEGSGRNMTAPSQLYLLFQNFIAVIENNLLLPNWAEKIFDSQLKPLVSQMVRITTHRNVKMTKILNGLLMRKVLSFFKRRAQPTTKREEDMLKVFLHVGHDITVMCLLASLGFKDAHVPLSSDTLVLELHDNPELPSKHEIKVASVHGRDNGSTVEVLDLPNCRTPCDLSTFMAQTERYTIRSGDWNKECTDMASPSDR